ncbi:CVNH domain protein [Ceratobasidium sp. AG-Ba]|nr:CVNH domain protein [Ceratobasidium sp. AG-Ba]
MSFSQTSKDIQLHDGKTLSAHCEVAGGGNFVPSRLDLDTCLGNIDGHFRWGEKNFSQSARSVKLQGVELKGDLHSADGKEWKHATVDLDQHIANIDGQLKYKK